MRALIVARSATDCRAIQESIGHIAKETILATGPHAVKRELNDLAGLDVAIVSPPILGDLSECITTITTKFTTVPILIIGDSLPSGVTAHSAEAVPKESLAEKLARI